MSESESLVEGGWRPIESAERLLGFREPDPEVRAVLERLASQGVRDPHWLADIARRYFLIAPPA